MTARTALSAIVLCLAAMLTACSTEDGEMKDAGGPRPNGVADMKPARAMAVARKAMNELHDAVYQSTYELEIDGESRRVQVVETVTADGCARVTSHPKFGRSWVRVIGKTMWMKANDRAGEVIGRTPAQIEIFRGRWLKLPAPALLKNCDLVHLMPDRATSRLIEATGLTEVDGKPGRRFRIEGGGVKAVFVIATEGRPIMLSGRSVSNANVLPDVPPGMSLGGTSVLTDTNTGAEVEPPPERLVIDPADYQVAPA